MRRLLFLVLLCGCATVPVQNTIDRITSAPALSNALWAIDIEDDTGNVIYERNAHTLVIPASNRKLFAAATVANCLGLDHQFATELWLDGRDLVLRGGGDPSLGGRYLQRRDLIFAPFVDALRRRGVTSIDGDLIADVSLFDRVTIPPSWKVGFLGESYAAPIDALAYNENVAGAIIDCPIVQSDPWFVPVRADITCGTTTDLTTHATDDNTLLLAGRSAPHATVVGAIGNAALYAAQALRDALDLAHIPIRGTIRINTTPHTWQGRVAVIESPPVHQLLTTVLKNSQNLYTDMLFKDLSTPGSFEASAAIERMFLTTEVGIDGREFHFVDGSGLAADDLVTAAATVKLLRWLNAPVRRRAMWDLYSTPAQSGTLSNRLGDLPTRVRAKTGTLGGVNALSGVIAMPNGSYRYFAIIANHHRASSAEANAAIDAIVREVARD